MASTGSLLTEYITLVNPDGSGHPGATWTVLSSHDGAGTPFTPVVADLGGGTYLVSYQTQVGDPTGLWYALIQADDPFHQEYEIEWPVEPTTATTGITRAELRRMVGQQTGDLLLATATATGSTSQVISTTAFTREAGAYQGRQALFTGGTPANLGLTRVVQGSDPTTRSITLADPLPAIVQAGDTLELYNQRGMGWRVEDIHEAINNAIRMAGDLHATIPLTVDGAGVFSRNAPEIAIPDTFTHFEGIDYVDLWGARQTLKPALYRVDRFTRTVEVLGRALAAMHGRTYRLRGHMRPPVLTSDADRTPIPSDWLVTEAVALLLGQDVAAGYGVQGRAQLYAADSRAADGKRPITITRYGANCVRLH